MKVKLKEGVTLKESREVHKLYMEGLDKNLDKIFKIIAVDEDGNELTSQALDQVSEADILDTIATYIEKKNMMMKSFNERITSS